LPPCKPQLASQAHQPAGNGSHHCGGQRQRHIEAADGPRSHAGGKPQREVIDDAREEPGFCNAEQQPQCIELPRRAHEHHGGGQHAPGKHDPRQPAPGTEAQHEQVRGHFTEGIADEEQARADPIDRCAEVEIVIHPQRGEADVHAVHERQSVPNRNHGQQVPCGFAQRGFSDGRVMGLVAWHQG